MSERKPAQAFHPGELIGDELRERGWGIDRLASALRCTEAEAQQLIRGQRDLNSREPLRLRRLFGASAEFWVNYQAAWDTVPSERRVLPEPEKATDAL